MKDDTEGDKKDEGEAGEREIEKEILGFVRLVSELRERMKKVRVLTTEGVEAGEW